MRIVAFYLVLAAISVSCTPILPKQQRIIGGDVTTIDKYPSAAALLIYDCFNNVYPQSCGSSIINKRAVLTAAHCISAYVPIYYFNMRIGSSYRSSGGMVHVANKKLMHPEYNSRTVVSDVGIVYSTTDFEYNDRVAPANIATRNYYLADNELVSAIGWGIYNLTTGMGSEQLREIEVYTINWDTCNNRYKESGRSIHKYMFCIGLFNIGGKAQCHGDSGSPVYHKDVVVGICSWGDVCASPRFPAVNVNVSAYSEWIFSNS